MSAPPLSPSPTGRARRRLLRRAQVLQQPFYPPDDQQSRAVPGPNAFAQKLREDAARKELSHPHLHHQARHMDETYSVSMYRGMQPSPTFGSAPFKDASDPFRDSPYSSSPYDPNEDRSSPAGYALRQQCDHRSDFGQRLHNERARLDTETVKYTSSEQQRVQGSLFLPYRPGSHAVPPHRMHLDVQEEQKLRQAGQDSRVSSSRKDLSAFPQTPPRRRFTPAALQLEHSNKRAFTSSDSPGRRLINKLGFGGPSFKPSQKSTAWPDPSKPDLNPFRNVPPKAAQFLGTQSLGCRHGPPLPLAKYRPPIASILSATPSDEEEMKRAASVPTKYQSEINRNYHHSSRMKSIKDDNEETNTEMTDAPESDNDRPPTPPSKSSLRLRNPKDANPDPELEAPSVVLKHSTHAALHGSANPAEQALLKFGPAGRVERPHIVDSNMANRSTPAENLSGTHVTGQLPTSHPGTHETAQLPTSHPGPNPQNVPGSHARSDSEIERDRRSLFYHIPEGGILLPTVYQPPRKRARPEASQPSPYSNMSESAGQLKPVPLNVPPHMRQEQSSQSSGSDNKSRDASNSTSASVPIFLETPSTANLRSAAFRGMATANTPSERGASMPAPGAQSGVSGRQDVRDQVSSAAPSTKGSQRRLSTETKAGQESLYDRSPAEARLNSIGVARPTLPGTSERGEALIQTVAAFAPTASPIEIVRILEAILEGQKVNEEALFRIERDVIRLSERFMEVFADFRLALQASRMYPPGEFGRYAREQRAAQVNPGETETQSEQHGAAQPASSMSAGGNATVSFGHPSWSPPSARNIEETRENTPSRAQRSLPARLDGPRRGTREDLQRMQ